jgi:hypothetical protein
MPLIFVLSLSQHVPSRKSTQFPVEAGSHEMIEQLRCPGGHECAPMPRLADHQLAAVQLCDLHPSLLANEQATQLVPGGQRIGAADDKPVEDAKADGPPWQPARGVGRAVHRVYDHHHRTVRVMHPGLSREYC